MKTNTTVARTCFSIPGAYFTGISGRNSPGYGSLLWLCLATFIITSQINTAQGAPAALSPVSEARQIVLLYDERTELPGLTMLDAGFVRALTSQLAERVEIYRESMDLSRFDSDEYRSHLRDHLQVKYDGRRIDAVVAVMEPALDFLLNHRDTIFPGSPIVFCGIDRTQLGNHPLPADVTGVLLKREFAPTLELAVRLHPKTDRIVVVSGASQFDARLLAQAREEFRGVEGRLTFKYLTALPMPELLAALSQLPTHTVVLYTSVFRDGAGQAFVPHEAAKLVSDAASVPVYGFVDQYLGRGIVGGCLYSLEAHGEKAAELVRMILLGRKPRELALIEAKNNVTAFDGRQLERWKIGRNRLPPGSEVRFHTPGLWEQYKWQLIAIQFLILAEAALIFVLVRSRQRVGRLAGALQNSESELLQGREALKDQLRFERLGTDISSMLMNAPAEELGKQIVPALGQMAQMLGFDAATLWLLTDKDSAVRAYGWHKPDTSGLPSHLTEKHFPWLAQELYAGHDVPIRTLDDFPPEAQIDRATANGYGLKSLLAVPMVVSSHLVGVLSMGSFQKELSVSPQLVVRQHALGNVFANALLRARSEMALRESERRLTLATTAGDLGLWLWNVPSKSLWATERARRMFGFAPETDLTYEMFYGRVHPEDRPTVDSGIAAAISGDANFDAEYRICLPDGVEKWIAARGEVAFEQGDRPISMTGIVSDITERRKNALELLQHRQELAHLSRISALGELSASLAHELNQPLTVILSNSQAAQRFMAARRPDLNELREILTDIVSGTIRAREVILHLRQLVKKTDREVARVDLNQIIEQVLKLLHSDSVSRNVSVRLDLAKHLPPVVGDHVQLQQVLLNLFLNAFDAMNSGALTLADRRLVVRTALIGADVCASICDSGPGIAPDKLEKIFDSFFTTKANGLGLGLSVCGTIIRAHGGKLCAANNAERGATFSFTLPVAENPAI